MENQVESQPEQSAQPGKSLSQDPAELAATFFGLYQLKLGQLINKLSGKKLRRAFYHAIVYPLEGENYSPTDEDEKNAFLIAMRLIEAKMVMIQAVELEKIREAQEQESKQPDSVPETEQVAQENENNGEAQVL